MTAGGSFNPYVPRPIDLPTSVPLVPDACPGRAGRGEDLRRPGRPGRLAGLAGAVDPLAGRGPAPARLHRPALRRRSPATATASRCSGSGTRPSTTTSAGVFTVDAFLDAAERDFGGFDGVVLWHAYPVIGLDERNQFDYYLDVAGAARGGARLPGQRRYGSSSTTTPGTPAPGGRAGRTRWRSPRWSAGSAWTGSSWTPSRRAPGSCAANWTGYGPASCWRARAGSRWPGSRTTRCPGRSGSPTRRCPVCCAPSGSSGGTSCTTPGAGTGTTSTSCTPPGSTGAGCWSGRASSGSGSAGTTRDRAVLRAMRRVQASHAAWLRAEDWVPLADHPGAPTPVYASRWTHEKQPLWTVVNRGDGVRRNLAGRRPGVRPTLRRPGLRGGAEPDSPAGRSDRGRRAVAGRRRRGGGADREPADLPRDAGDGPATGDPGFPARAAVRRPAPVAPVRELPDGMVAVDGGRYDLLVRHRVRETGLYGEAPYVDEWKPLPPRLHHPGTLRRCVRLGRFAIDTHEVTHRRYAEFRRRHRLPPDPAGTLHRRSGAPRRPGDRCRTRRRPGVRRLGRAAPADRGRVAGGRRGGPAAPGRAAGVEPDRERAHRRSYPVRDPQGRCGVPGRRLGLVSRRRPATPARSR